MRPGRTLIAATATAAALALAATPAAAAPGEIYVLDNYAYGAPGDFGSGGIIGVDPATGARRAVFQDPPSNSYTDDTHGIDVAPDGGIVYSDLVDGAIYRVDPSTGTRTRLTRAGDLSGLAVEDDGRIVYVDQDRILRLDPTTRATSTVTRNSKRRSGPELVQPLGITLEPDGDIIVADSLGSRRGSVVRVDPETGRRTTVSNEGHGEAGLNYPRGVAVEESGDIVVLCQRGGNASLVRAKAGSGRLKLISRNSSPTGDPRLESTGGIALADTGEILVADFGGDREPGVIGVDPRTGERRFVSSNSNWPGEPTFFNPIGITVAP